MEKVVLVDESGQPTGECEKMEAHEQGLLHKAFSIIIWNQNGEMLLQQRSMEKYHWPGIWSNACCSHPRIDEEVEKAAHRRLQEELGLEMDLEWEFDFVYRAKDSVSGLIEHEHDSVFAGKYDGNIPFNPEEVMAVQWMEPKALLLDIEKYQEKYSPWFRIILNELVKRSKL